MDNKPSLENKDQKKPSSLGVGVKGFLFHNSSARQTVAKNTFWLTVGNILGRLLRAGIVIYAARILGAEDWGIFSYAIGLVAFLTLFTDMGVSGILTREMAKNQDPDHRSRILSTSFFIIAILLVVGILVVVFAAPYFTKIQGVESVLLIVATVLIFDTLRDFGFSVIRAHEKMQQEAGIFILTNFSIVALGLIFLEISPTVKAFTISYSIGTGIGTVATFIVLRDYFRKVFSSFTKKLIKPILTAAWPFAMSTMLGGLLINTDILIIGIFMPAADVGFYSAAQRPILLLYLIPAMMAISIFPMLSRLATDKSDRIRSVMERAIAMAFMAGIPLALGGLILGPAIMKLLFGTEFLPGASSFQILALTMVVNFPAVILTDAIFAYNKQKYLITFVLIGGILNIALDLLLIPKFGIVGSAWATLIAQSIANAYLWRKMQQINYFNITPHMKRIVPASILMAILAWILTSVGIPVLIVISLAAIFYFGILYATKEPLIEEVKEALRLKG